MTGASVGGRVHLAGTFLVRVEVEAEQLGHKIIWGTIGDSLANGRCARCGGELTVAVSKEGMSETAGALLKRRCQPTHAAVSA